MTLRILLVFICSSMVVVLGVELGVELSCTSTICPGDVVQCECQVTSNSPALQWLARDLQSEENVIIETYVFNAPTGVPRFSGPYTTVLFSATSGILPVTLTSQLTATLTTIVDVTCRDSGGGNSDTTRLTVAGRLSTIIIIC